MSDPQFKATLEMFISLVTCYGALHTMGGLAITEDIKSLIDNMK